MKKSTFLWEKRCLFTNSFQNKTKQHKMRSGWMESDNWAVWDELGKMWLQLFVMFTRHCWTRGSADVFSCLYLVVSRLIPLSRDSMFVFSLLLKNST